MPAFWMLVRDAGFERSYKQILDGYRDNPCRLLEALPHRDPTVLAGTAERLCLLLWKDFLMTLPELEATEVQVPTCIESSWLELIAVPDQL